MTKEDIQSKINEYAKTWMNFGMGTANKIGTNPAGEICDELESRACVNCKHIFNNGLIIECWNNKVCNVGNRLDLEWTNKDFGCNKFEREA